MNGFEALRPLAADLKEKAKEREAQKEKAQKVQARIAKDTQEFLDTMRKTGVKAASGVKIAQHVEEKDIDFASAMRKAGVAPLGVSERVQHKKNVRPEPRQTIADNESVLEESLSDELDSIEFLESDDGKSFRRPGIGPDVPRDLRRGRWSIV